MAVVTRYIISLFKQNAIGHNAISLHKVLTLFWAETDNFGTQLREICLRRPGPIPLCKIASSFYRTDRPGRRHLSGFSCKNQDAVSFESFSSRFRRSAAGPGALPRPTCAPKKRRWKGKYPYIVRRRRVFSPAGGRRPGEEDSGFRLQMVSSANEWEMNTKKGMQPLSGYHIPLCILCFPGGSPGPTESVSPAPPARVGQSRRNQAELSP